MPEKFLNKRNNQIAHSLVWVLSIAFFTLIFYLNAHTFTADLIAKALITNIGFALSVYVNLYLLIPKLLKQKSYIFYVFWLIVLLSGSSLFVQFFLLYPLRNVLHVSNKITGFDANIHSAFFFISLIYVGVSSFLKLIKDWIALQDVNYKLAQIEKQKIEAELNTLKGQLNPHFLFNSLNNIYSLALVKSDKVPHLILKLSDLMRHIIYESKENYIDLEKEIEFVDNFIALQEIRVSADTDIRYEKSGELPAAKIAPLLFEPFIDNAFKHGLPGNNGNDFIHIRFQFSSRALVFTIANNYAVADRWDKKHSGIGIANVKQRLALLYPPGDYTLKITNENAIHTVQLTLILKPD